MGIPFYPDKVFKKMISAKSEKVSQPRLMAVEKLLIHGAQKQHRLAFCACLMGTD